MQKYLLAGLALNFSPAASILASSGRDPEAEKAVLQVEEMQRTVSVAEKNPARFGLSQPEITSRRKWITQTKQEVSQSSMHQQYCTYKTLLYKASLQSNKQAPF